jgi:hypothetical protein
MEFCFCCDRVWFLLVVLCLCCPLPPRYDLCPVGILW